MEWVGLGHGMRAPPLTAPGLSKLHSLCCRLISCCSGNRVECGREATAVQLVKLQFKEEPEFCTAVSSLSRGVKWVTGEG